MITAFVVAAGLALAGPAWAGPATSADEHRAQGYAHAERGEWDEAVRAYELAYAIDRDPVSLYAIGRIQAQRGDCAQAREAFARFLATDPPPRARASAQDEIERCRPAADPDDAAGAGEGAPAPGDAIARPAHRTSFYRDPLGDILVGSGVIAGGLGGYFYLRARAELCTDPCTGSYQAYQDSVARARTWRTGAIVAGGLGGALVVGGLVRWVLVAGDHGPAEVDVAWTPRPGGGALVVGGRF